MRFRQVEGRYIVRLEWDELVIESLTDLLRAEGVEYASISAAGAVRWVSLEYWNADTRAYERRDVEEQLEVVSFLGNASLKGGEPFLHVHGVFGRGDFSVYGGHVREAQVRPTLEVWMRTEDVHVSRVLDNASGLYLLDLPERLDTPQGGA